MSVDLSQYRRYTIPSLDGGIDGYTARNLVDPTRCIDANNLYFDRPGKAVSRKDFSKYATSNFTSNPIKSIYQYRNRDGAKRILCYDGVFVWVDDGAGVFNVLVNMASNDGHVRFIQSDSILLFGNELAGLFMWHPDMARPYQLPKASEIPITMTALNKTLVTEYFDANSKYYYRATAEIGFGKTTIYETPPLFSLPSGSDAKIYTETVFDPTVFVGWESAIIFHYALGAWPEYIRRLNIWRSDPKPTSTDDAKHERSIDASMRLLFSVDVPAGSINDITSPSDNGSTDMSGRATLDYDRMDGPPKPRYMVPFQSRVWLGYVVHDEGDGGPEVTGPSRIFASKVTRNGNEAGTYTYSSFTDINREDNDELMGIMPASANLMLIIKRLSVWGLYANGDTIPESTQPAINIRLIDGNVGCVATETIEKSEGTVTWMSQRGPVAFSGGKVVDIGLAVRDELLDAPSKETTMLSQYDPTRREIKFIHAKKNLNDGDPASAEVFNLERKTWGRQDLVFGIGATVAGLDENNDHVVYAGLVPSLGGSKLLYSSYQSSVVKLDQTGIPFATNSPFLYQTPMLDLGSEFMDKKIIAILFHAKLLQTATLHVIADNRLDTRQDAGGGFTVTPAQPSGTLVWDIGKWDVGKWGTNAEGDSLAKLDDRVWGKRFSFILSGTVTANTAVDLRSMTIFYKPLKGVR